MERARPSIILGNIDEQGRLEDNDFLDDESKRHLGALSYLGGGDINVRGILAGEDGDGETSELQKAAEPAETADVKDADAVS